MSTYASSVSVAVRRAECARVQARHPEMVPVVLEATGKHAKVSVIAVSPATTIATLQETARSVSDIHKRRPVALSVDGCVLSASTTVGDLCEGCKAEDGFLYVSYSAEKVMGGAVASGCSAGTGSSTGTTTGTGTTTTS